MSGIETRLYDPGTDEHMLTDFARLHTDSILVDGQPLTLLPPLDDTRLGSFWMKQHDAVKSGIQHILVALAPTNHVSDDDNNRNGGGSEKLVVGVVCLTTSVAETGPFRGWVTKLMVSVHHRRQGIARLLMGRLEDLAREKGATLLLLDTTVGTAAEHIYPRLGWIEYGMIPKYAILPLKMEAQDEKFFYKDLRV